MAHIIYTPWLCECLLSAKLPLPLPCPSPAKQAAKRPRLDPAQQLPQPPQPPVPTTVPTAPAPEANGTAAAPPTAPPPAAAAAPPPPAADPAAAAEDAKWAASRFKRMTRMLTDTAAIAVALNELMAQVMLLPQSHSLACVTWVLC